MAEQTSRSPREQSIQKASRRNSVAIIIFCSLAGYVGTTWFISRNLNTRPQPSEMVLLIDTVGKDTVVVDTLRFSSTSAKGKLTVKDKDASVSEDEDRKPVVVVNCGCCPGDTSQKAAAGALARRKEVADSLAAVRSMLDRQKAATGTTKPPQRSVRDLLMNRNPRLLIWCALVCLMVAFACACAPIFIDQWLKLRALFPDLDLALGWNVLSALCVGVVLFRAPVLMDGLWLVDDFAGPLKTFFATSWAFRGPLLFTIVCACIGIGVMFSISSGIGQLGSEKLNISSVEALGRKFDALNKALRLALQLLAIMVAFAVLTSNSLRLAFRALLVEDRTDTLFPVEFVHVYGLFFSAVLAIIYLPIHYRLTEVGEAITEKLKAAAPAPAENATPPNTGLLQRVFDKLSVTGTGYQNLMTALSILAPALTSLIAKFFEVG